MKIFTLSKLVVLAVFILTLAAMPRAFADDINPDADVPDISTMNDTTPPTSVLEIPQQCDEASVAALCDHSDLTASASPDNSPATDGTALAGPSPGYDNGDDSSAVASNPNVGSAYDYANQNTTNDAYALSTAGVPLGASYPLLARSPVIVSTGPVGPGAYQQWVPGPGSYRQWAPGPGYIAPMPTGFHPNFVGGFTPHMLGGGFGVGHFGHR